MASTLGLDVEEIASAVNRVSSFLAAKEISNVQDVNTFLHSHGEDAYASKPTDVIVLCASSVLSIADTVFSALSETSAANGSQDEKIAR